MVIRQRRLVHSILKTLLAFVCAASACVPAHADASLLLEEPFGDFGAMNPTGHAAIYLNHVCADTPVYLRPCAPGEIGVVISRYHRIDGYDWLAIPLIPYLYAVDDVSRIPDTANARLELKLRDAYRREHLEDYVPDDPKHEIPRGDWTELVGASYDRRIWGFDVATTPAQDATLIRDFNARRNVSHFNLFFNNCANFSEKILNFYYPHSIHRNFIADAGMMTPKQAAKSLVKYSRRHPSDRISTFVIPQVPGSIPRSTSVDGVVESLIKSKKYLLPLAYLHPYVTGTLVAAYFSDGRFHPDSHADVFDTAFASELDTIVRTQNTSSIEGQIATRREPSVAGQATFPGNLRRP